MILYNIVLARVLWGIRVHEDLLLPYYQRYYWSGVNTISTLADYYLRFHSQNSDGTVDGIPGLRLLQDYISVEDEVRVIELLIMCVIGNTTVL